MAIGDIIPGEVYGLDLTSTDGKVAPPLRTQLDSAEVDDWFLSFPNDTAIAIRLYCVRLDPSFHPSPTNLTALLETPRLTKLLEHAVWGSAIYRSLAANPGGGAVSLADEPWRFILRTPEDGGPCCSFAAARHGRIVKAIYLFNAPVYDPELISATEKSLSGWKSTGLQIVTLAHTLVHAQAAQRTGVDLANILDRISRVESTLTSATHLPPSHPSLSHTLHSCAQDLVLVERRSRFEALTLDAIDELASRTNVSPTGPWSALRPLRMAIAGREFDFTSLPRRIDNARATLAALVAQRNEQLNLELAVSSERIAEATFADSKSMKTIAVVTMVFLPGTAVASLFSMSFFDWSASSGSGLASRWLWVYFVVAVPLTAATLAVWWAWGIRAEALTRRVYAERERRRMQRLSDPENGGDGYVDAADDDIELQDIGPIGKGQAGSGMMGSASNGAI